MDKNYLVLKTEIPDVYYHIDKIDPLNIHNFNRTIDKLSFYGHTYSTNSLVDNAKYGKIEFPIKHHIKKNVFCLVNGGWLPPAYPINSNYILDRNIVSSFYRSTHKAYSEMLDWFDVIKSSDNINISSLFSALENKDGDETYSSFKLNTENDSKIISSFLPKAGCIFLNENIQRVVFDFIFKLRSNDHYDFLDKSITLIKNKIKLSDRHTVARDLMALGKSYNNADLKNLIIICLSCIYEGDTPESSFARKIIKPTNKTSKEKLTNCLNDLIFIDVIMFMKRHFDPDIAGVTADKSLAMFWCALNPDVILNNKFLSYHHDISDTLFYSANENDLIMISDELKAL